MFNITALNNRLKPITAILVFAMPLFAARAADLSNNIGNTTSGVEPAVGARTLAASFNTDALAHTLSSVTLLLATTSGGAPEVSIYSDANLHPGTLIATLTAPSSVSSSTPLPAVFTGAGQTLTANTTYWIVLRATSGSYDWGWTNNNNGTGAGFQHAWAISDDSGAFWWFNDNYPVQFSVTVDVASCTGASVSTQPSAVNSSCGGNANFAVAGAGTGPLSYQWRRNTTPLINSVRITGATAASLSITGLTHADDGSYDCIISNTCGSATSNAVALSTCPGDFNCSGSISVQDIFDYLTAYFGNTAAADFNGSGAVSIQDLFDYLAAYFAGCN